MQQEQFQNNPEPILSENTNDDYLVSQEKPLVENQEEAKRKQSTDED